MRIEPNGGLASLPGLVAIFLPDRVGENNAAGLAAQVCAWLESVRGEEGVPQTKWDGFAQLDRTGQILALAAMAKDGVGMRLELDNKLRSMDDQLSNHK